MDLSLNLSRLIIRFFYLILENDRNEIEDSGISVICDSLLKLPNLISLNFNLQEYFSFFFFGLKKKKKKILELLWVM